MVAINESSDSLAPLFSQPLPPSERDFEIFGMVVIEGASTRAAAKEFALSQTRIVQVRDRVAEWIAASVPPTPRLTPRQRLTLAAEVARQRMDFLYSQAMGAWRSSQTQAMPGRGGSCGDGRYLMFASRITEHALRVSSTVVKVMRGQESAVGSQESDTSAPPVGACSLETELSNEVPDTGNGHVDASHEEETVSDEIENRRRAFLAALKDDADPVQPPVVDANGMLVEEEAEDVEQPVLSLAAGAESQSGTPAVLHRPLNRRERRARQRMLARKLRQKAR